MKKKVLMTTASAVLALGVLAACGEPVDEGDMQEDPAGVEDPAADLEEDPAADLEEDPAADLEEEPADDLDQELELEEEADEDEEAGQ
ncbi:hypothetical protein P4641_05400 [Halalkalibacterium halodurans]|uniref:hypothetical protein n=1 Tax=Halalkalibacterium halodurans TaxID=86665 RepID=UPI002E230EAC|nr:hypothetical protein [Halalkalibacterium halodurans]